MVLLTQAAGDLPSSCALPPRLNKTELSSWESFTLLEEQKVARTLNRLACRLAPPCLHNVIFESDLSTIPAAAEYYCRMAFHRHPEEFYPVPACTPTVIASDPCPLSHGEVVDFAFATEFQPKFGQFAGNYAGCAENQTAYLRMWRHPPGKSRATLIAIHGWMMGDNRLSAVTLVPGFFFRLGLDVILYELPYHGRRAPAAHQHASLFPSFNIARTNEGFAQAIAELRSLALWVRSQNDKPLGVLGLSLGGYTAALWASLDELAFAVLASPLVSMAELARNLLCAQHGLAPGSEQPLAAELSLDRLREIYALHCPLSYSPKLALCRRLILAGAGDDLIPREQPEQLWRHWRKPRIEWLSGGHFGHVVEPRTLHYVHSFLRGLGLALERPLEVTLLH